MNCRTRERRKKFVNDNEIKPIAHIALIKGQAKISCTGDTLENSYYSFMYKHKTTGKSGTFICGSHAADDFLKLLDLPTMKKFNPLIQTENLEAVTDSKTTEKNDTQTTPVKEWHPSTEQLNNAISLLMVCWNTELRPPLSDIKAKLEQYADRPPFLSQVKTVNTVIAKDFSKRTIQQMIEELAQKNSMLRFKTFSFDLLNDMLNEEKIVSLFG